MDTMTINPTSGDDSRDQNDILALGNALYAGTVAEAILLGLIRKDVLSHADAIAVVETMRETLEGGRDFYPLGAVPVDYAAGRLGDLCRRLAEGAAARAKTRGGPE